jgi:hypothetical protein
MYNDPKSFEKQCYTSFPKCKNRNIWSIIVGITHQMTSCPGPYLFKTIHSLEFAGLTVFCIIKINSF